MRISTIEIKMLIKECVSKGGMYTTADLCAYISRESDKDYTRSQISGAIAQLIDLGDLVRIERGLYAGKETAKQSANCNEKNSSLEKDQPFRNDAILCLNQVEKSLENFTSVQKIWELSNDDFEILSKIRSLKTTIEKIRKECE